MCLFSRLLVVAWAYGRLIHARGPTAYRLTGFTPRQRPSRSTTNKRPTHIFTQSCTQPSIHPASHPSVHSPTHPFTHPFIHPTIHSPTHPFIHSPTHPFIHPSIHPPSTHEPSIQSPIHPHVHSSTLSFIHPSIPIHPFSPSIHTPIHPRNSPSTNPSVYLCATAYRASEFIPNRQRAESQPPTTGSLPIETQCNNKLLIH